MSVIDRNTYKKVEYYLYNYQKIRKEVEQKKQEIIESGGRDLTEWGGGISYCSDPTAAKAVKLVSPELIEKEKWLKIIEHVIIQFNGTDKGKLIQKKYFEELDERNVCQELHIGRATYFRWREEIVIYTAMLALQEGMIRISNIA